MTNRKMMFFPGLRRLLLPGFLFASLGVAYAMNLPAGGDQAAQNHGDHPEATPTQIERAVAVMQEVGDSGVSGVVYFTKVDDERIRVTGKITGLEPGLRAFHVHEYGDLTDLESGLSACGHFNPTGDPHGDRHDEKRHVGDLGNLEVDENGVAEFDFVDDRLRFEGPHSIIGRGLVVHAGEDQFTQPTGDAGPRAGLGVIGIAHPENHSDE